MNNCEKNGLPRCPWCSYWSNRGINPASCECYIDFFSTIFETKSFTTAKDYTDFIRAFNKNSLPYMLVAAKKVPKLYDKFQKLLLLL